MQKKVYYKIKKSQRKAKKISSFLHMYVDSFSRDHSIEEVREDAHKKEFF